jgi:hypothetical protein
MSKPKPFPKLLLLSRLLQPLKAGRSLVDRVSQDLTGDVPVTLQHGAFALAVSAMEVGLSDSLKYYLQNFPEKIPREFVRNLVNSVPVDGHDLVVSSSERYTTKLSYDSFHGFLRRYESLLSIGVSAELPELLQQIQEIKATRNLLLHNGLEVNDFYLEQAGEKKRAKYREKKLTIDRTYVEASLLSLAQFLDAISSALAQKYSDYTNLAANRRLWNYLFESPVMPYTDFWDVDETEDRVVAMKYGPYEKQLSSCELVFLGLWRAHFNGDGEYLKSFHMRGLDSEHGKRFHFVLSIARDFPWEGRRT